VARISARLELPVASTLEPAAAEILAQARWPGNLSDLVRVLEHAVWQSHGGPITPKHLPDGLETTRPRRAYPTLKDVVAEAKRTAIQNALEHTGGDMPDAAKLLGCNVKGLYRLMKTLGMPVRRTK
jgi:DNA-binding NtrC family response regulator